jgi:hypothetical protein
MENQHKIRNNVLKILVTLPEEEQLYFALAHQHKIKTIMELTQFLQKLPENIRFSFALSNGDKIKRNNDLISILRVLAEENRLDFTLRYQDKIQQTSELITVVRLLPEADRVVFAIRFNRYQPRMLAAPDQYALVSNALPEKDRALFENAYQHTHQNNHGFFAKVSDKLESLPSVVEDVSMQKKN